VILVVCVILRGLESVDNDVGISSRKKVSDPYDCFLILELGLITNNRD
jgi:hypothetical protein